MSTDQFEPTRVALITDDLAKAELIGDDLEAIAGYEDKYPGVADFATMKLTSYSSTDKARGKLFSEPAACSALKLIVLDGTVRKESVGGTPGNSVAAMALLDWLNENMPDVPVIVLASTRVEGLDLRLARRTRRNIRVLDIAESNVNAELARVLHGALNSQQTTRLRVTLRVGEYTARYYMVSGGDLIKSGIYEYRNLQDLYQLLDTANDFSPMVDGRPNADWQSKFREFGDDVYNSLIRGTIGDSIIDLYKQNKGIEIVEEGGCTVELRFDFEVAANETARLYALPLELAKPPEDYDNFLCTRVPMARRIRFVKERKRHADEEAYEGGDVIEEVADSEDEQDSLSFLPTDAHDRPDRPLRLLFINASFKGSAVVRHDMTGQIITIPGLNQLLNTPDELKVVKSYVAKRPNATASPPLESVTVVSPGAYKTADKFQSRIEQLVRTQPFDILHYSGHSVTLPHNGGTFLIFPDASGVGRAVSVRVLADWVRAAGIRMVLLSSCSGSSLRTAIEIMRTKAEAVLGFRWDVNDHACVEYFKHFYDLYLTQHLPVPYAYCGACNKVRSSIFGLPIWASAIAVVKN